MFNELDYMQFPGSKTDNTNYQACHDDVEKDAIEKCEEGEQEQNNA